MPYLRKDQVKKCINYNNNNKKYIVTISFFGIELDSFVFFINSDKQKDRIKNDLLKRLRFQWFRIFVKIDFKKY